MGFYIDLEPVMETGDYLERRIAPAYFSLFVIGGFALACMFLAAYSLLWELAKNGSGFDLALVIGIGLAVPIYLLIGVKLFWLRRFVDFKATDISTGYFFGNRKIVLKRYFRADVVAVEWENRRPSQNVAPKQHDNDQYFIRGHWRILLRLKNGSQGILDRHTEREALESLYERARGWFSLTDGAVK